MRFALDPTWLRVGELTLMAGSPPRLFRLTAAGARVVSALEAGAHVARSGLLDRLAEAGAIHPRVGADDPVDGQVGDVTIVTPQLGGRAESDGRITVDDGSEPPVAGATIRLAVNAGPGAARNAGRRLVETPYVLFVDADVDIPQLDPAHPDHDRWWRVMLGHLDDPSVGAVAPRVVGDARSSLDLGPSPALIRLGGRVAYVPGAVLLVRSAAFDDVGGFDPTLRVGEDVDLVWRLDQAGWRCRYEPAAEAHHRPRGTVRERLAQQSKYGSSSGPLALRHPRALAPFRSGRWSVAVIAAALVARPVSALAGVAAVGASARQLASTAPEVGPALAVRVAARAHGRAIRQFLAAVRRAWWPLLVPLVGVRRVRWLLLAAAAAAPVQLAPDVAFSLGLWRSALRSRTVGPLVPDVSIGVRAGDR